MSCDQTVFEQVAELDAQKQIEADSVLAQATEVIKSLDPTGMCFIPFLRLRFFKQVMVSICAHLFHSQI